jgi:short-chain fatty acids transporter
LNLSDVKTAFWDQRNRIFSYTCPMKYKFAFPSPLAIALFLTAVVFLMGVLVQFQKSNHILEASTQMTLSWYNGLWDTSTGGLYFAFQMIFILVLGHVLALTQLFRIFISNLTRFCTNSANSAVVVSLTAIVLAYINWGLALVLAALLVKEVLLKFQRNGRTINIGLIGAAAYASMLVWHGGLSGSSPTKAMEPNALREMMTNAGFSPSELIPKVLNSSESLFSTMNIFVFFALLLTIPLLLYLLAKKMQHTETLVHNISVDSAPKAFIFRFNSSTLAGIVFLACAVFVAIEQTKTTGSGFLNINFINLCLLGLGLLLHNSLADFSSAVKTAIGDASGILVQFPLYFGIIGMMKYSGLTVMLSEFMVQTATTDSLPIYSFFSAGLLNFFIPSGGGQFYVQGPLLLQAAADLDVSISKTVMAISYGDQWTNMLQPFWALPLLGITKIKLREIFPYCLALFVLSGLVFASALYWF